MMTTIRIFSTFSFIIQDIIYKPEKMLHWQRCKSIAIEKKSFRIRSTIVSPKHAEKFQVHNIVMPNIKIVSTIFLRNIIMPNIKNASTCSLSLHNIIMPNIKIVSTLSLHNYHAKHKNCKYIIPT